MFDENKEEIKIIKLTGVPNKNNNKEKKIWSSFLIFIKKKWELGNDFLIARVMREKAEAIASLSAASKTLMEAKEIALRIEEKEKEIDVDKIDNKQEVIDQLIKEISNDLKNLEITKGTKIAFEIDVQVEDQVRVRKERRNFKRHNTRRK